MRGMRGVAIVACVLSLVTLAAAIVDGAPWTIVSRAAFVLFIGVLTYRMFTNPQPARARTKQQFVLYVALVIPLTLVMMGVLTWVAVVNDDTLLRVVTLICVVGVLGFSGWVTRVVWQDYQPAYRAKYRLLIRR